MWVSPFRYLRLNGYLLLPAAFRSLSRLSSALSAKASTLRSFLLDLFFVSIAFETLGLQSKIARFVCFHKLLWLFSDVLIKYILSKSLYEVFKVQKRTSFVSKLLRNFLLSYFIFLL